MNRVISGEFDGSPIKILNGTKFLYIKYDGEKFPLTGDYVKSYDYKTSDHNFITGGGKVYVIEWINGGKSVIMIDGGLVSLLVAGCETTINDNNYTKNKKKVSPIVIVFLLTILAFVVFIIVGVNSNMARKPSELSPIYYEDEGSDHELNNDHGAGTEIQDSNPTTQNQIQPSNETNHGMESHVQNNTYVAPDSNQSNATSGVHYNYPTTDRTPGSSVTSASRTCYYIEQYGNKTPQQLAEESPVVNQYKEDIERAQRDQRQYANGTSDYYRQKYTAAVFAEQKARKLYETEYNSLLNQYQSLLSQCN